MSNLFDFTEDDDDRQYEEYKLSCKEKFEALNLDYYPENNNENWYLYISHLEHRCKFMGVEQFVYNFLSRDAIQSCTLVEKCYTLGYVTYLCNKNNLKLPDYMNYFKGLKLDKILFDKAPLDYMIEDSDYTMIYETYVNRIPELMEYNICCNEIDTAV